MSVTSHPQNRPTPSRGERATGFWDSEHEAGSCGSCVDPDSGISVVSSKTGVSNCSMADYCSTRDRTQVNREKPGVVPSPGNQLVTVLMPEKLIKDPRLSTSSDVNRPVNRIGRTSAPDLRKSRTRVRSFRPQHKLTRMDVYSENTQGPRILGSEQLDELDQHSSFDVISVDSSEVSFDENCNRVQCKNVNQTLHGDQYSYEFNSSHRPATQRNANQIDSGRIKTQKHRSHKVSVPKYMASTCYPSGGDQSASDNTPPLAAVSLGVGGDLYRQSETRAGVGGDLYRQPETRAGVFGDLYRHPETRAGLGGDLYRQTETRAGLHGLIPSLQEFVDFLQERRRKLSFTNTEGRDDRL